MEKDLKEGGNEEPPEGQSKSPENGHVSLEEEMEPEGPKKRAKSSKIVEEGEVSLLSHREQPLKAKLRFVHYTLKHHERVPEETGRRGNSE
jgi:hypothetical protein